VAALLLKATIELPLRFGTNLLKRYEQLAAEFVRRATPQFVGIFPEEPAGVITVDGYLWARTVTCPYCGGVVPLSPNWKLSGSGYGARLIPENGRVRFEIVEREVDHSPGTVKGGDGSCPFPECGRTIDGDEIKAQAQAGRMDHQLYCVVYKEERTKGYTKNGTAKVEKVRGFRAPRAGDDVQALIQKKLEEKMPLWQARNIIPDEEIDQLSNYDRGHRLYGMFRWRELFSPRQLFGHCVGVEVFQDMVAECVETDLDRAAIAYVALALDKMIDYNAVQVRWHANREVVAGVFDRHNFSFYWSYAEIVPAITGLGYDWVIGQTGKALGELIDLLGQSSDGKLEFTAPRPKPPVRITCTSADTLPLEDASVDCVVMDPPYYDNVMYAELSDFFYVWLKRTAGLLYPDLFTSHLTDKDREAVANSAKFAGQKGGAKNLAGRDYQRRMASIFKEQRRVLKPDGIMTVMFTHKAAGAWDALAGGLIDAGFTITASWPVNTESESSLHIREKSAARSTIFLVCRVREAAPATAGRRLGTVIVLRNLNPQSKRLLLA
jgi:adenine-specific DNA methylase